ncbi:HAD family phosphatase [Microbulbifer sp. THAF38]|uniref:HAD family hydrolase n=1 Tax=Microbulbifer sp. THAF38 TaxID=2587856 RepID=UPI0020A54BB0|nr:HAD family hydrolase [Microbulbifer sp. THAF38]
MSAELPSWNNTATKSAIVEFVNKVTQGGSPDFVPPEQRIAVFDNDGTLWAEKPAYFQLLFAIDEIKRLAPEHPEWQKEQPYAAILNEDISSLLAQGKVGIEKMVGVTHVGVEGSEFNKIVTSWLSTAKNPLTDKRYRDMVYQPMRELLDYLRDKGFKTFISSGGSADFIRVFSYDLYGIPPEQVIGSRLKLRYENTDGHPRVLTTDKVEFLNDRKGKPIGIKQVIGHRPIFVAGNSDGDLQMLEWSTTGKGPRFGMLIHHTDGKREWAYDRNSSVGYLDKALLAAKTHGWTVVDMAKDWSIIFPKVKSPSPGKETQKEPALNDG